MSYCVNCGVELDASATKCPLCDTPVYNPKAPEPEKQPSPFPKEKGQVEVVKRKDINNRQKRFIFLTVLALLIYLMEEPVLTSNFMITCMLFLIAGFEYSLPADSVTICRLPSEGYKNGVKCKKESII